DSPTQFRMAVLDAVPGVTGVSPGVIATVSVSGATTYSVDDEGQSTTAFSFIGSGDLMAGQEVQVKELSTSSGAALQADRVRLRSSRFTATVSSIASPNFNLMGLPGLFTSTGTSVIQVQTSSSTEFAGSISTFSQLTTGKSVTLRGQLFRTGATPVLPAVKVRGN
ncbi:MAG: hypothetical protein ACRD5L_15290, partial [Bryobacteraceae bacterium]